MAAKLGGALRTLRYLTTRPVSCRLIGTSPSVRCVHVSVGNRINWSHIFILHTEHAQPQSPWSTCKCANMKITVRHAQGWRLYTNNVFTFKDFFYSVLSKCSSGLDQSSKWNIISCLWYNIPNGIWIWNA